MMNKRFVVGILIAFLVVLGGVTSYLSFNLLSPGGVSDTEVSWAEVCGGMWWSQGPCPSLGALKCDGSNASGQMKIHICYPDGYVARDSDGNYHVCGTGWLDTTAPCYCGDGHCMNHTTQENSTTCPQDCGSVCGDGVCNGDETSTTCAQDCPVSVCGNGTVETGETCDDSNTTSGDGCSSTCQTTTQCNDGIDNDGDGRTDCQTGNSDPGCFPDGNGGGGTCSPTDNTETDTPPVCGNGTVETGEQCDDSNTTNGDGCSSTCQTTTACNDGVDNDGDGNMDCSATNPDPGCFPDGNGGGGTCSPTDNDEFDPICGNSTVEAGELCDDGNTTSGDGCSSTCQTTTQCNDGVDNDGDGTIDCAVGNSDPGCFPDGRGGGGTCNPNDTTETNTPASCGDGVLDPGEGCDNGTANANSGAACNLSCQPNAQCNDGIDNDGDGRIDCAVGNSDPGCFPNGRGGGGACNVNETTEADTSATCGDGILDTGEACDNGTANGNAGVACSLTCQLNTPCNDGIDNDGDGRIDCQVGNSDPGCFPDGNGGGGDCATTDTSETNKPPITPLPQTGITDSKYLLIGFLLLLGAAAVYKFGIGSNAVQSMFNYSSNQIKPFENRMEESLKNKVDSE